LNSFNFFGKISYNILIFDYEERESIPSELDREETPAIESVFQGKVVEVHSGVCSLN